VIGKLNVSIPSLWRWKWGVIPKWYKSRASKMSGQLSFQFQPLIRASIAMSLLENKRRRLSPTYLYNLNKRRRLSPAYLYNLNKRRRLSPAYLYNLNKQSVIHGL
jgi:hypothetical protein